MGGGEKGRGKKKPELRGYGGEHPAAGMMPFH